MYMYQMSGSFEGLLDPAHSSPVLFLKPLVVKLFHGLPVTIENTISNLMLEKVPHGLPPELWDGGLEFCLPLVRCVLPWDQYLPMPVTWGGLLIT